MQELIYRKAIEQPVHEGQYALDEENPLKLYNCLVPEISAYRHLKLERMNDENRKLNYYA